MLPLRADGNHQTRLSHLQIMYEGCRTSLPRLHAPRGPELDHKELPDSDLHSIRRATALARVFRVPNSVLSFLTLRLPSWPPCLLAPGRRCAESGMTRSTILSMMRVGGGVLVHPPNV